MVEPLHCIKGPHLVWWDRCNKCVLNESYADGDGDGECIKGPYLVGWDRCNESYANADDDDYSDFGGWRWFLIAIYDHDYDYDYDFDYDYDYDYCPFAIFTFIMRISCWMMVKSSPGSSLIT